MAPVTLHELRAQFTGEHLPEDQPDDHGDGWATRPFYSPTLACEIAKRTDPQTEGQLRQTIFHTLAVDGLPDRALEAVGDAFCRYQQLRKGRGL